MIILVYIAYFFGGMFFVNAIPHWVSGIQGKPFQSPFAKPPGKGLSSSMINVLWAAFNFFVAYLLIYHVGLFEVRDPTHMISFGLGGFFMSVILAKTFAPLHGGDRSTPLTKS